MKKLVILDVDNCLILSRMTDQDYDFQIPYYYIKKREHLDDFLNYLLNNFDVGIWSANSKPYVHAIVEGLGIADKVKFIHTEDDCLIKTDSGKPRYIKYIGNVERYGYDMKDVIMVDDNPKGFPNFKDNVIFIPPFEGKKDDDLLKVKSIIDKASSLKDVRGSLNF
jgi:RNA polymerase II subunit A small phosphatase-like protein